MEARRQSSSEHLPKCPSEALSCSPTPGSLGGLLGHYWEGELRGRAELGPSDNRVSKRKTRTFSDVGKLQIQRYQELPRGRITTGQANPNPCDQEVLQLSSIEASNLSWEPEIWAEL